MMRFSMPTPEYAPPPATSQEVLAVHGRARALWERDPSPRTFALLRAGIELLYRELGRPGTFALGQLLMTPGADAAMREGQHVPPEFLLRHKHGDWGELPPEDVRENERALRDGGRLFSAYQTRTEEKLWVITEWDRSVTTLLLPEEY
jgi:hypothetical protein